MTYYSLSNSHRAVLFGSDVVYLNLDTNQYNALNAEASIALQVILKSEQIKSPRKSNKQLFSSKSTVSKELQKWTEEFLNAGLIKKRDKRCDLVLSRPLKEGGLKDYTWVLQNNRGKINNIFKVDVFKNLMALIITNRVLRKQGIKGIINLLQKQSLQIKQWETPPMNALNSLMFALDRACQYYPRKVVCLAWASAFVYLCLKRGWFVQFVVGVQLHPFLAHAWVEREGEVIGDREDINSYLGVLLREPQLI